MDSHIELLKRYRITAAQLDAAERIEDYSAHRVYYRLPSQTRPDHEHIVTWNPIRRRLECTCEAGQDNQTCWAMRAAACHAAIIKQERKLADEKAMDELAAEIAEEAAIMARITNAPLQVATDYELEQAAQLNENRTFRFMR